MATEKFKTGDIVVLKSSSENMTVEAYTDWLCNMYLLNGDKPVNNWFY